jgi:head-tail adaptor
VSETYARRLTLEARDSIGDGGGGEARSWRVVGRCWADLRAASGLERMSAGAAASRVSLRAAVPWTPATAEDRPTPEKRFREGERVLEIVAVGDADPWRRRLICWLAEGAGE